MFERLKRSLVESFIGAIALGYLLAQTILYRSGIFAVFFFSSRRRHTRLQGDWSSDVCSSDLGAPTHSHPVEEVLTVREGEAEMWIGDAHITLSAGQSLIVPAGRLHGFRNCEIGRASCRERV